MDTIRVKIEDVKRGDLIPGWGGAVVADTLSASTDGVLFWYDTNGQRHAWGMDGAAIIYVPTFQTQAIGYFHKGAGHILLSDDRPVCGAKGDMDVWRSATALASVTCRKCRRMYGLIGTHGR